MSGEFKKYLSDKFIRAIKTKAGGLDVGLKNICTKIKSYHLSINHKIVKDELLKNELEKQIFQPTMKYCL